jgi:hypothetical protein
MTRSEEGDKEEQIPFRWRKKKWAGLGLRKKENGQGREKGFGRFSKQISNNVFKTRFMFQTNFKS